MNFEKKKIASALLAISGMYGSLSFAQSAENPMAAPEAPKQEAAKQGSAQKIDKIEVTGSAIKRVQAEGPAPVEVITKKDIERTGATNVNELLRSIPSIDIFDQGELSSNSPAGSGTANVRMRGLSENNVLVLLNGRRLPVNAIYDSSGAGAAVDVNMIPLGAIERVEILKDGGSAIYGADAVAGVINFITKKDYQGMEARLGYGISSHHDGEEKQGGVSAGFGDYDQQGFNVLAAFDVFKREPIYRKDREISRSVDFRRLGGSDGRSSFAPEGNIVNDDGSFTGRSVKPCAPENFRGRCRYDFNASLLSAYNGADRWSSMLVGNLKITSDIKAFGQLFYAESKDHFQAHPVPDFFLLPSGDTIAGRFMQGGPRVTDRKSKLDELVLGLEGNLNNKFDWNVAVGQGKSKVTNSDSNYYNADLWNDATGSGRLDPTVTTNDSALVQSLKISPVRRAESKVSFLDAKVSGEIMELNGGPLGYAVGVSTWREGLQDTPDALTQAGKVVGSIKQSAVDASRTAKAIFAEVSIPLVKNLEVQTAVRYDRYPGESKTSPKLAASYKIHKDWLLRASYTESFRVPSLKQLYGAQDQGAVNINGSEQCKLIGQPSDCDLAAFQINGSNPGLKPEKGKTLNLGVAYDVGIVSGTLDWWRIEKTDNISTPTILTALRDGAFARNDQGRLSVFTNLRNFAQIKNEGLDLDMSVKLRSTLIGNITFRDAATYYYTQDTRDSNDSEWEHYNGTYRYPRWRNAFNIISEWGDWSNTLTFRSVAGFSDTDDPSTASEPIPADTRRVKAHHEIDWVASYTGIKKLKIDGGVKNILNREPPFSLTNASDNQYSQMGFAELYSSRGRFFFVNATYQFK